MELTLDNFKLSIAIISGRFSSSANIPMEGLIAIGWQSSETPTMNEARELAEKYISVALQDLSTGVGLVSSGLSEVSTAYMFVAGELDSLRARIEALEG